MLFIKKWRIFLNIQKEGFLEPHAKKLKEIRLKAVELEHWETVRDCDRFEATYKKDKKLMIHLLFGTAHEKFSDFICNESQTHVSQLNEILKKMKQNKNT